MKKNFFLIFNILNKILNRKKTNVNIFTKYTTHHFKIPDWHHTKKKKGETTFIISHGKQLLNIKFVAVSLGVINKRKFFLSFLFCTDVHCIPT